MTLAAPAMPAIVGMAATIASTVATATGNGLACRTFLRCGQNHASKEKDHSASEHHQQDSEMHPSGWGHLSLALFPRLGRHFNSTMWM